MRAATNLVWEPNRQRSPRNRYRGEKLSLPRIMFPDDSAYQMSIRKLMEAMQDRNPTIRHGYRQFV